MDKRTRILLFAAIGVAGLFLVYNVFYKPWNEKRKKLEADLIGAQRSLSVAKAYLGRRVQIEDGWEKVESELRAERKALTQGLDLYISDLVDKTIQDSSRRAYTRTPLPPDREGDFVEHLVEVKGVKFKIDEFTKFLVALNNDKDFLRIRRLAISTKYDTQDDVISVELKASTLEYDPIARKP
jgi:hypothetical protein